MCIELEYIFFHFASDSTLRDQAKVVGFMSALVEQAGLHSTQLRHTADTTQQCLDTPDTLADAWGKAVSRARGTAWVSFESSQGMGITFGVYGSEWRRAYLSLGRVAIGSATPAAAENLRAFVAASELFYQMLQPDYGYGLISLDSHTLPPLDSAVEAVYDYNFLSPALVDRFGRERLLSIFSVHTAIYDDGGLMLAMSPNPMVERKQNRPNYEQTARILGLEKIVQGG